MGKKRRGFVEPCSEEKANGRGKGKRSPRDPSEEISRPIILPRGIKPEGVVPSTSADKKGFLHRLGRMMNSARRSGESDRTHSPSKRSSQPSLLLHSSETPDSRVMDVRDLMIQYANLYDGDEELWDQMDPNSAPLMEWWFFHNHRLWEWSEWWNDYGNRKRRREPENENAHPYHPTLYHKRLEDELVFPERPEEWTTAQLEVMRQLTQARQAMKQLEDEGMIVNDPDLEYKRDHGLQEPANTKVTMANRSILLNGNSQPPTESKSVTRSKSKSVTFNADPDRKTKHVWTINDPYIVDLRRGGNNELVRKLRRDTFLNFYEGPNFSFRERDVFNASAKFNDETVVEHVTDGRAGLGVFNSAATTGRDGVKQPLRPVKRNVNGRVVQFHPSTANNRTASSGSPRKRTANVRRREDSMHFTDLRNWRVEVGSLHDNKVILSELALLNNGQDQDKTRRKHERRREERKREQSERQRDERRREREYKLRSGYS